MSHKALKRSVSKFIGTNVHVGIQESMSACTVHLGLQRLTDLGSGLGGKRSDYEFRVGFCPRNCMQRVLAKVIRQVGQCSSCICSQAQLMVAAGQKANRQKQQGIGFLMI